MLTDSFIVSGDTVPAWVVKNTWASDVRFIVLALAPAPPCNDLANDWVNDDVNDVLFWVNPCIVKWIAPLFCDISVGTDKVAVVVSSPLNVPGVIFTFCKDAENWPASISADVFSYCNSVAPS